MNLPKDFNVHSFLPPGLIKIDGKTFVVPGWHEVPEETTLEEVHKKWTRIPLDSENPEHLIMEEVESSNRNKKYLVTFNGKNWDCSCVGFEFRRTCKHVKQVKEKHNLKL